MSSGTNTLPQKDSFWHYSQPSKTFIEIIVLLNQCHRVASSLLRKWCNQDCWRQDNFSEDELTHAEIQLYRLHFILHCRPNTSSEFNWLIAVRSNYEWRANGKWSRTVISCIVFKLKHVRIVCMIAAANEFSQVRVSDLTFWFGTRHNLAKLPTECRSSVIQCADVVRDLGVLLDSDLYMQSHISKVTSAGSACIYHLRRLRQIRNYVTQEVTAQLVTSLVISRLDYCNSVLAGLPASTLAPLQRVQNTAARLVLNRDRRSHIIPALQQLHWLPSSTASSSRLRRWCTTFYIIDIRHISSTWLHSTRQTLIDVNPDCRIPEQPSWNWHGPNSVNAPSRLVVPTYGTVFLQQSATLTVIQHLDELWSHIYFSVLLLHNFLSVFTYWLL